MDQSSLDQNRPVQVPEAGHNPGHDDRRPGKRRLSNPGSAAGHVSGGAGGIQPGCGSGDRVASAYGILGPPETYFIAADGRVVGHVIGTVDDEQLREGTAAAKAGRPVGAEDGGEQRPVR